MFRNKELHHRSQFHLVASEECDNHMFKWKQGQKKELPIEVVEPSFTFQDGYDLFRAFNNER